MSKDVAEHGVPSGASSLPWGLGPASSPYDPHPHPQPPGTGLQPQPRSAGLNGIRYKREKPVQPTVPCTFVYITNPPGD